jgi:protein-tyrosine-phosphatase
MKVLFVCVENAGRSQIAQPLHERRGGEEYLDWNLPDPAGLCLEEVRELRGVIEQRVSSLPL